MTPKAGELPEGTLVHVGPCVLRRRRADAVVPWKDDRSGSRFNHDEVDHYLALGATVELPVATDLAGRADQR